MRGDEVIDEERRDGGAVSDHSAGKERMELGGTLGLSGSCVGLLLYLTGCFHSPVFLYGLVVLSMHSCMLGTSQITRRRKEDRNLVHVRTKAVEPQERACRPRKKGPHS